MKAFETASTGHRRLAVLDFLMGVKARIHTVNLGTMWASVFSIVFYFLERSFLLNPHKTVFITS